MTATTGPSAGLPVRPGVCTTRPAVSVCIPILPTQTAHAWLARGVISLLQQQHYCLIAALQDFLVCKIPGKTMGQLPQISILVCIIDPRETYQQLRNSMSHGLPPRALNSGVSKFKLRDSWLKLDEVSSVHSRRVLWPRCSAFCLCSAMHTQINSGLTTRVNYRQALWSLCSRHQL